MLAVGIFVLEFAVWIGLSWFGGWLLHKEIEVLGGICLAIGIVMTLYTLVVAAWYLFLYVLRAIVTVIRRAWVQS